MQDGVPLAASQALPQPPQFATLLMMLTSQPSVAVLLQSAEVTKQLIPQVPAVQEATPALDEQSLPHVPQCVASVPRFDSHPLVRSPSQLPNPAVQLIEHWPFAQDGAPVVDSQTWLQEPQLLTSLPTCSSQPLVTSPSQSPQPAVQPIWHEPKRHDGVPWAALHIFPHWPHWVRSLSVLISQPLDGLPSQSA